ncbi:hypothetical protein RVN83_36105 [Streptomyces sp. PU10]|nr:hypothetical protein [Streptomyces sp. PU10]MDU0258358.1 hypothetical protein [Streptomyces sp. PU10]
MPATSPSGVLAPRTAAPGPLSWLQLQLQLQEKRSGTARLVA